MTQAEKTELRAYANALQVVVKQLIGQVLDVANIEVLIQADDKVGAQKAIKVFENNLRDYFSLN